MPATVFTPFYGEFGWLVMTHLRYVHAHPADEKIVYCERGTECLYPSATRLIPFDHPSSDDNRWAGTVWGDPSVVDRHREQIVAEARANFPGATIEWDYHYDCHWHLSDAVKFKPVREPALPKVDVVLGVRNRRFVPECNFPHWQQVADTLRKQHGLTVGLAGLKSSSFDFEADVKAWDHPQGATYGSVDLLSDCRLYVGTDSGVSHLAALMDTPMVVWYRPHQGSPNETGVMQRANKRYCRRLDSGVAETAEGVVTATRRALAELDGRTADNGAGIEAACDAAAPFTIVGRERCRMLYRLAWYASALAGEAAEVGVYRGGTSLLIRSAFPRARAVHAFDTFAGIVNADESRDGHHNGDFADLNADETINRLTAAGLTVHKGLFPATAEDIAAHAFCFAHFDGDTHASCRDFLSFFWPRMTPGGILVFDDWRWHQCKGVERAVMEHHARTGAWPFHSADGQCVLIAARRSDGALPPFGLWV